MQLQIFTYEHDRVLDQLTTVEINGEVWFLANDVCKVLEIQNSRQAVMALDDDEKLVYTLHTSGQRRQVNLINESGLYALIFRSKKEEAKKFRKWVTKEVIPKIRKEGSYGINRVETPNFILRYMENYNRVEKGYFSVITELFVRLYARFEHVGYRIPNKAYNGKEIRPDVSVGICFAKYLRDNYPSVQKEFKKYVHRFPNGQEVEANLYPIDLISIFIKYVDDVWIPNNAEAYFHERDRKALEYLPKLLKAS
ncbi:MAG: BRO-N domain-containing protein [Agriterribacter sp.]